MRVGNLDVQMRLKDEFVQNVITLVDKAQKHPYRDLTIPRWRSIVGNTGDYSKLDIEIRCVLFNRAQGNKLNAWLRNHCPITHDIGELLEARRQNHDQGYFITFGGYDLTSELIGLRVRSDDLRTVSSVELFHNYSCARFQVELPIKEGDSVDTAVRKMLALGSAAIYSSDSYPVGELYERFQEDECPTTHIVTIKSIETRKESGIKYEKVVVGNERGDVVLKYSYPRPKIYQLAIDCGLGRTTDLSELVGKEVFLCLLPWRDSGLAAIPNGVYSE